MKVAVVRILLILGALGALSVGGLFGIVALVNSLRLTHVVIRPDITVYDKKTKAAVPGCLLAFGPAYMRELSVRTGPDGRYQDRSGLTTFTYSSLWSFTPRRREPMLRFSLGQIPAPWIDREAEVWEVRLQFNEPWSWPVGAEIAPQVHLRRSLVHEEDNPARRSAKGGTDEPQTIQRSRDLGTAAPQPLVRASVRLVVAPGPGGALYDVPLSITLDGAQIAACQADTPEELLDRTEALLKASRCVEAREALGALRFREDIHYSYLRFIQAYDAVGACLARLGQRDKATETFATSARLWPDHEIVKRRQLTGRP